MNEEITNKLNARIETEKTLIGAIIRSPEFMKEITNDGMLSAEMFMFLPYQKIYITVKNLFYANKKIDLITIADKLSHDMESGFIDGFFLAETVSNGFKNLEEIRNMIEKVNEWYFEDDREVLNQYFNIYKEKHLLEQE